jgi:hypothetical protein
MSVKMVFWAQLIEGEGWGARPSLVTLQYLPLHSSDLAPSTLSPAKLARDSYTYTLPY